VAGRTCRVDFNVSLLLPTASIQKQSNLSNSNNRFRLWLYFDEETDYNNYYNYHNNYYNNNNYESATW